MLDRRDRTALSNDMAGDTLDGGRQALVANSRRDDDHHLVWSGIRGKIAQRALLPSGVRRSPSGGVARTTQPAPQKGNLTCRRVATIAATTGYCSRRRDAGCGPLAVARSIEERVPAHPPTSRKL
jgi:hypothetical protein